MKQDRFLMVILGVIGLMIVVAVGLFILRQEPQEFGPEDSPEGVLRNYILSLQTGDFQRAYSYLQDAEDKPNFTTFQQSLVRNETEFSRTAIQLGEVDISGSNARVAITVIHANNDPFDKNWAENTTALLTMQDGEWCIINLPYPYWGWDWYIEK